MVAFCTYHKTVLLLREFISQSSEKQLKRVYFYQSAIKSEAWLEKRAERRKREVTHQQVKGGVVSPKEDRGPLLYSLILRNDGKLDLQKWMMGMKNHGCLLWDTRYEKCTKIVYFSLNVITDLMQFQQMSFHLICFHANVRRLIEHKKA